MRLSLEGKVALVTGGGIRLGRVIAQTLAAAGATVAVHHHTSHAGADETVAEIRAAGGAAERFGADLTSEGEPERLVAEVERGLGAVDILVNSAAGFERVDFVASANEVLDRQWALNARAPFILSREAAKGMLARGRGDILNVLDIGGTFVPWKRYAAYCMTKAALGMLTQCLAVELAPAIRVNGVAPGTVLPPERLSPEELAGLRARVPMQRFGTPQEVADAALFLLAGPQFVTGQILAVDGGRLRGTSAREP